MKQQNQIDCRYDEWVVESPSIVEPLSDKVTFSIDDSAQIVETVRGRATRELAMTAGYELHRRTVLLTLRVYTKMHSILPMGDL